jgi:hypothetical protein
MGGGGEGLLNIDVTMGENHGDALAAQAGNLNADTPDSAPHASTRIGWTPRRAGQEMPDAAITPMGVPSDDDGDHGPLVSPRATFGGGPGSPMPPKDP